MALRGLERLIGYILPSEKCTVAAGGVSNQTLTASDGTDRKVTMHRTTEPVDPLPGNGVLYVSCIRSSLAEHSELLKPKTTTVFACEGCAGCRSRGRHQGPNVQVTVS